VSDVIARKLIEEVFGEMTEMPSAVQVCNAVRGYADGSTRALLIVRGCDDRTHLSMSACFEDMEARTENPEFCVPVDLRAVGVCTIRPDSVSLETETFSTVVEWGETSTWWTDVALADGSVYAGLMHHAAFDRLAEQTDVGLMFSGPLPEMPFIRLEVQAA